MDKAQSRKTWTVVSTHSMGKTTMSLIVICCGHDGQELRFSLCLPCPFRAVQGTAARQSCRGALADA